MVAVPPWLLMLLLPLRVLVLLPVLLLVPAFRAPVLRMVVRVLLEVLVLRLFQKLVLVQVQVLDLLVHPSAKVQQVSQTPCCLRVLLVLVLLVQLQLLHSPLPPRLQ
jgi:hypothetical protein